MAAFPGQPSIGEERRIESAIIDKIMWICQNDPVVEKTLGDFVCIVPVGVSHYCTVNPVYGTYNKPIIYLLTLRVHFHARNPKEPAQR